MNNKGQSEDIKFLPLLSIITVCRNSEATINQTFRSVYNQSYKNIEYIVVDGLSSDGTQDIISEYQRKFQSKGIGFQWVSEKDKGIYDAMNKGIAMSKGEIIGILNSDDFYEPGALERIASVALDRPQYGIFYGFLRVIMNDGRELQTYRYRYENYLLNTETKVLSGAQHPTCFVRRNVYDQIGGFDLQFPIAADYDFLLRAMKTGIKFYALNKVLCNFRLGGISDCMNDYERFNQRYGVLKKNNLLSESDAQRMKKYVKYQKYKAIKQILAKKLFRI